MPINELGLYQIDNDFVIPEEKLDTFNLLAQGRDQAWRTNKAAADSTRLALTNSAVNDDKDSLKILDNAINQYDSDLSQITENKRYERADMLIQDAANNLASNKELNKAITSNAAMQEAIKAIGDGEYAGRSYEDKAAIQAKIKKSYTAPSTDPETGLVVGGTFQNIEMYDAVDYTAKVNEAISKMNPETRSLLTDAKGNLNVAAVDSFTNALITGSVEEISDARIQSVIQDIFANDPDIQNSLKTDRDIFTSRSVKSNIQQYFKPQTTTDADGNTKTVQLPVENKMWRDAYEHNSTRAQDRAEFNAKYETYEDYVMQEFFVPEGHTIESIVELAEREATPGEDLTREEQNTLMMFNQNLAAYENTKLMNSVKNQAVETFAYKKVDHDVDTFTNQYALSLLKNKNNRSHVNSGMSTISLEQPKDYNTIQSILGNSHDIEKNFQKTMTSMITAYEERSKNTVTESTNEEGMNIFDFGMEGKDDQVHFNPDTGEIKIGKDVPAADASFMKNQANMYQDQLIKNRSTNQLHIEADKYATAKMTDGDIESGVRTLYNNLKMDAHTYSTGPKSPDDHMSNFEYRELIHETKNRLQITEADYANLTNAEKTEEILNTMVLDQYNNGKLTPEGEVIAEKLKAIQLGESPFATLEDKNYKDTYTQYVNDKMIKQVQSPVISMVGFRSGDGDLDIQMETSKTLITSEIQGNWQQLPLTLADGTEILDSKYDKQTIKNVEIRGVAMVNGDLMAVGKMIGKDGIIRDDNGNPVEFKTPIPQELKDDYIATLREVYASGTQLDAESKANIQYAIANDKFSKTFNRDALHTANVWGSSTLKKGNQVMGSIQRIDGVASQELLPTDEQGNPLFNYDNEMTAIMYTPVGSQPLLFNTTDDLMVYLTLGNMPEKSEKLNPHVKPAN